MKKLNPAIVKAAKAAGTTPENFARTVRGILRAKTVSRHPRHQIFTAQVLAAIRSK